MEGTGTGAVAESIGTFAFVFFGAGTIIATGNTDQLAIALASGLTIAIMVSSMLHISGAVFNPAIQAALWVTGKMPTVRSVVYIVAQLAGAVAAAALLKYFSPPPAFDSVNGGTPSVMSGYAIGKAVLVEAIATFFLVWAVFATVIDDRGPFGRTAGFTIGLVVTIDILAVGPLTGAAVNPARWFGPALVTGTWTDWWVWVAGPIAGGLTAGIAYRYVFLHGRDPATP